MVLDQRAQFWNPLYERKIRCSISSVVSDLQENTLHLHSAELMRAVDVCSGNWTSPSIKRCRRNVLFKVRATDTQSYWHCFASKCHYSLLSRHSSGRWRSSVHEKAVTSLVPSTFTAHNYTCWIVQSIWLTDWLIGWLIILTTVNINNTVYWHATACSGLKSLHFGETSCLYLQGFQRSWQLCTWRCYL
jgi:hypothetical protein